MDGHSNIIIRVISELVENRVKLQDSGERARAREGERERANERERERTR